jgi:hypothetical protein
MNPKYLDFSIGRNNRFHIVSEMWLILLSPASHGGGPWFDSTSDFMGFMVNEVALELDFSENFSSSHQLALHQLFQADIYLGLLQ